MKRLILAASLVFAVFAFSASAAMADSAICHDGSLSDDVGQGCTNDGAYGGAPSSSMSSGYSDGAICHDGNLADDAGHNCADGLYARIYGGGSVNSSSSSVSSSSSGYSSSGSYSDVPGVPASFAACVATRESSNGAGSSNIYGILGGGGEGSLAQQKAAFSQMYAARGTEPWAPYDGC